MHVDLHALVKTERTARADPLQDRGVHAKRGHEERAAVKWKERDAANRQLLNEKVAEHDLLLRLSSHIQLLGPEIFELRNVADGVLLHRGGVVERPRHDDLFAGEGAG